MLCGHLDLRFVPAHWDYSQCVKLGKDVYLVLKIGHVASDANIPLTNLNLRLSLQFQVRWAE